MVVGEYLIIGGTGLPQPRPVLRGPLRLTAEGLVRVDLVNLANGPLACGSRTVIEEQTSFHGFVVEVAPRF